MRNKKVLFLQNKGARQLLNLNDFISRMPDEILVVILSLLPIKNAVVTSTLSSRWTFLWCCLMKLNFDASERLHDMSNNSNLCISEGAKFVQQVNSVIKRYKHPRVQCFRMFFNLDRRYDKDIKKWLKFVADKKVEILELDFMENSHNTYGHFFKWQSSNRKMVYLKKLYLKSIFLSEESLADLLSNSPNLEALSFHHLSSHLTYIDIGGRALNLKHFEISYCFGISSISLYDFDLVSFTYKGPEIQLRLEDLPKLKKVDMGQYYAGSDRLLAQISSCALSLHTLTLHIYIQLKSLNYYPFPELPFVKKLTLTIGAYKDKSLLKHVSIANACPSLKTFTVELIWILPTRTSRKASHVPTDHPHKNLTLFQILGYYGRISDLEFATCIINNSAALKKIVIDPRCQQSGSVKDFSKKEEAARSSAKSQLVQKVPGGVELVIL